MTLGALLVGVAAVTFAIGMNLSLLRVMNQLDRGGQSGQSGVDGPGGGPRRR